MTEPTNNSQQASFLANIYSMPEKSAWYKLFVDSPLNRSAKEFFDSKGNPIKGWFKNSGKYYFAFVLGVAYGTYQQLNNQRIVERRNNIAERSKVISKMSWQDFFFQHTFEQKAIIIWERYFQYLIEEQLKANAIIAFKDVVAGTKNIYGEIGFESNKTLDEKMTKTFLVGGAFEKIVLNDAQRQIPLLRPVADFYTWSTAFGRWLEEMCINLGYLIGYVPSSFIIGYSSLIADSVPYYAPNIADYISRKTDMSYSEVVAAFKLSASRASVVMISAINLVANLEKFGTLKEIVSESITMARYGMRYRYCLGSDDWITADGYQLYKRAVDRKGNIREMGELSNLKEKTKKIDICVENGNVHYHEIWNWTKSTSGKLKDRTLAMVRVLDKQPSALHGGTVAPFNTWLIERLSTIDKAGQIAAVHRIALMRTCFMLGQNFSPVVLAAEGAWFAWWSSPYILTAISLNYCLEFLNNAEKGSQVGELIKGIVSVLCLSSVTYMMLYKTYNRWESMVMPWLSAALQEIDRLVEAIKLPDTVTYEEHKQREEHEELEQRREQELAFRESLERIARQRQQEAGFRGSYGTVMQELEQRREQLAVREFLRRACQWQPAAIFEKFEEVIREMSANRSLRGTQEAIIEAVIQKLGQPRPFREKNRHQNGTYSAPVTPKGSENREGEGLTGRLRPIAIPSVTLLRQWSAPELNDCSPTAVSDPVSPSSSPETSLKVEDAKKQPAPFCLVGVPNGTNEEVKLENATFLKDSKEVNAEHQMNREANVGDAESKNSLETREEQMAEPAYILQDVQAVPMVPLSRAERNSSVAENKDQAADGLTPPKQILTLAASTRLRARAAKVLFQLSK